MSRLSAAKDGRQPDVLVSGRWPLMGRLAELERFRAVLAGASRGLVLVGPAGVGKTRLTYEFGEQAKQAGMAIVQVTATRSGSALPLGAFAPFLPVPRPGEPTTTDNRDDLLHRCARAIILQAGARELLLLVDDAHLLDDASATLVHQLVATEGARAVATVLSGMPVPDPMVGLWKDELAERVEVGGLHPETVEQLLTTVLGGPVDGATAARLTHTSEGNALFLRELVLGAAEDGTLVQQSGIWRLVAEPRPSTWLTELVEARLAGLSQAERELLEMISVGEPLGMVELSTVGDPTLVEELEHKDLVTSAMDGRRLQVRLAHPLYGDVLRSGISALRMRQIARALAEAVESTGARRREDILRVAAWRLDGGGGEPERMLAAATIARWSYDFPLAEKLARAALQSEPNFDAAFLAANLASLQGRPAEADDELCDLMKHAADDWQRLSVGLARLDLRVYQIGRIGEGLRISKEAEQLIEDPDYRDEIVSRGVALTAAIQGPRAAAAAAEPLLARARGRALVWAARPASWALGRLGRLSEAREIAERGIEAAEQLTVSEWYPWNHVFYRNETVAHSGHFEEAFGVSTDYYQRAVVDRSPEGQAWFAWQLSKNATHRGYPRTAAVHGRTAVAIFRQLGRPQFEHFALASLGTALALMGRTDQAKQAVAELDTLGMDALYWACDGMQTRAWITAISGDIPSATAILEDAAATADATGDLVGEASALHALARLGHPQQAADRLESLTSAIEGDLIRQQAIHARALVDADAVALEHLSVAFETSGAILLAAEASADAAVSWRRAQDPRRGAKAERRSGVLAERCESPKTPALQAVKGRAELTRAEREVSLLARSGHSNKEIAARLSLSRRTVENQLQHAYGKLGVTNRRDLSLAMNNEP